MRLVRTDSPGRPPRLSHSSWTMTLHPQAWTYIYRSMPVGTYRVQSLGFPKIVYSPGHQQKWFSPRCQWCSPASITKNIQCVMPMPVFGTVSRLPPTMFSLWMCTDSVSVLSYHHDVCEYALIQSAFCHTVWFLPPRCLWICTDSVSNLQYSLISTTTKF